ncbi:MAG TPA: tripartite tricarboxylate transporter permease [Candidatus Nanoarchaeia archaeon]|nr:tripartite tricarboxylate transporter permease [Candidatus Nanoarchaeia archaeon]
MFLEIIIALILGIGTGIITGLTPGLHINLVSLLVLSFSPLLLQITSPIVLGVYIIAMAITHTFLDAIPSIYLGAPDESQALNVLPGHRLLMKGEGHNAIVCTVIGALGAILLGILFFPVFILLMKWLAEPVTGIVGYLLILLMVYMIWREKEKKIKALALFLLSGTLGLLVFSIPTLEQPLFPLLSGLFGFSILLISLAQKSVIPEQKLDQPLNLSTKNLVKSVSGATGMGFIAAFLPGFGSSQAAIIATNVVGDIGDEGFLTLVGGINTANMLISIAAAYILDKSRNGAILVVNKLLDGMSLETMLIFLAVSLVAAGAAALLTINISKIFARVIVKVKYSYIILSIIIFITLLTIYFDGFLGLIILGTATALGLISSVWGVGKNHLMGCLLIPVILYFVL